MCPGIALSPVLDPAGCRPAGKDTIERLQAVGRLLTAQVVTEPAADRLEPTSLEQRRVVGWIAWLEEKWRLIEPAREEAMRSMRAPVHRRNHLLDLLRLQPLDTGADESGGDCGFVDALEVAKLPQCVTAAIEESGIDQGRYATGNAPVRFAQEQLKTSIPRKNTASRQLVKDPLSQWRYPEAITAIHGPGEFDELCQATVIGKRKI